jgi:hypothetical protein
MQFNIAILIIWADLKEKFIQIDVVPLSSEY